MAQRVAAPGDRRTGGKGAVDLDLFKTREFIIIAAGTNGLVPDGAAVTAVPEVELKFHGKLTQIKAYHSPTGINDTMEKIDVFRKYGLFDARVPRYTSYPPANRFAPGLGQKMQRDQLAMVPLNEPLSIYVHIPFCRRLCWFCACRTQGTQTRAPIDGYIDDVIREIGTVSASIPGRPKMARLHLGGGTPTLLSPEQMARLLQAIYKCFERLPGFQFSIEVDPTEADPDVINELSHWDVQRASIGVQDFRPEVQAAIGRRQSVEQTQAVVNQLRHLGINSLNIDLLYGLPHQTDASLTETLEEVIALRPDRIALYGYAHVPNVSKRQQLIDEADLPKGEARYHLADIAKERLERAGHLAIGIDHFAAPGDGLADAHQSGRLRRNFQGYTDDPCRYLIGLGASAISQTPDGYVQNATATGAYRARVSETGLAGYKGYRLTEYERAIARAIEMLMCEFRIDAVRLRSEVPGAGAVWGQMRRELMTQFADLIEMTEDAVRILPGYEPLVRLVAAALGGDNAQMHAFSRAI